ncbi:MAG: galactokinase family protein [Acutalibacteraceae bacterium]|nr:galactokinase family protein [Acutalibacteraceae bacterium]
MTLTEVKNKIQKGGFDSDFNMLYGDAKSAQARHLAACDSFKGLYKEEDGIRLFSAPGRTEIGGNHTDHQHGCVLAGGVNLDVIAVVAPNNDGKIRIKSEGYDMDVIDIDSTDINPAESGKAISLIRGVCAKFKELGADIKGFNAYTTSNVLKGSGLSSSAAFEVLVGTIINGMFFDNKADEITVAKIGQYAEREYFGKPCGLLDQMASSLGGFTYADFNNPASPITEKINLDIHSFGYTLCVVDTGGNHADLTQDYADITIECKKMSNALGVDFLRDADEDKFYASLATLRKECGDRAILRAFHFFNEQKRVEGQKAALKSGDFEAFLRLVNESGESSYDYLQNLYSNSNVAEQGLPLALALTKQFLGDKGACRVHGGGFAGTIQCYIPTEHLDSYKQMIEKVFGEGSCCVLNIRPVGGFEIK